VTSPSHFFATLFPAYRIPPPRLSLPFPLEQVRALCAEQPLADIYAVFEDHVARLVAENEALRRRNLALETKDADADGVFAPGAGASSRPRGTGNGKGNGRGSADAAAAQRARVMSSFTASVLMGDERSGFGLAQGRADDNDGDVSDDSLSESSPRSRRTAAPSPFAPTATTFRGNIGANTTHGTATATAAGAERVEDTGVALAAGAVSTMLAKAQKHAARLASKLKRVATEKEELRGRYVRALLSTPPASQDEPKRDPLCELCLFFATPPARPLPHPVPRVTSAHCNVGTRRCASGSGSSC